MNQSKIIIGYWKNIFNPELVFNKQYISSEEAWTIQWIFKTFLWNITNKEKNY